MNKLLPLIFKGSRGYLHGSDFFNILMNLAQENTGNRDSYVERLTFRQYASKLCELTDIKPILQEKLIGQVRYSSKINNDKVSLWIAETDNPIVGRYPFDETVIIDRVRLEKEKSSVTLLERSNFSPIEDVIVLTKCLNYSVSPITSGSWLFGQMDLTEPLTDNYQSLEIKIKHLIDGKFSVNDIFTDGRMIGSIRFIVGQEL